MKQLKPFVVKSLCCVFLSGLLVPGFAASSAIESEDAEGSALSIDSTIGQLLDNPKSLAILDKRAPGMSTDPQIKLGRFMSLRAAAPLSGGKLTEEMLKVIEADLSKLK